MAVIAGVAVLAGLVMSTWWLFLGSDTTYQHDANGRASGPYEAPQVVACVAVLALLLGTFTLSCVVGYLTEHLNTRTATQ